VVDDDEEPVLDAEAIILCLMRNGATGLADVHIIDAEWRLKTWLSKLTMAIAWENLEGEGCQGAFDEERPRSQTWKDTVQQMSNAAQLGQRRDMF
jgi:hypothetical protein